MSLLSRFEAKLGRFAIQQLTLAFVVAWVLAFGLYLFGPGAGIFDLMVLDPKKVLAGEVWRLVSFLLIPPTNNVIFFIIAVLVFYMIGSTLEAQWGAFRYNCYILLGWLGTVLGAFLPMFLGLGTVQGEFMQLSNSYMLTTLFFAFATLFPDYTFYLFFILPVKVKWLALISALLLVLLFVQSDWGTRCMLVLVLGNYFLFFGGRLWRMVRGRQRRLAASVADAVESRQAFHTCAACGATERSDPDRTFRVCGECAPPAEYCDRHLKDHEHRRADS